MRVKIADNIFFEYLEGEWHIITFKANKSGIVKEKVDYQGDINRCICALLQHGFVGTDLYKRLYSEYKKTLQDLLSIKDFEANRVEFNSVIEETFLSYPDVSGANTLLEYVYSTDHGMSETGKKKSKRYLTDYYQVATYILGVETGEVLRKEGGEKTVDELVGKMSEVKQKILETFS